jgi:hypothetical protein
MQSMGLSQSDYAPGKSTYGLVDFTGQDAGYRNPRINNYNYAIANAGNHLPILKA